MDPTRRRLLRYGIASLTLASAGCYQRSTDEEEETDPEPSRDNTPTPTPYTGALIDDWQLDQSDIGGGGGGGLSVTGTAMPQATGVAPQANAASGVGAATGGAKDINNFRQNIEEGYLPLPSDVSYEGLFYEYYFETGDTGQCTRTFCPTYATAISADPLGETTERYLRVGLDSGLSSLDRKPLNLVVVLDISGSMSSRFNEYHYDPDSNSETEPPQEAKPKIDVAGEALAALTEQLRPEDNFGIVVYNNQAQVAKPVNPVGRTDMDAIRGHVKELKATGGTNLSAGISTATELQREYDDQDRTERETRTIILTDAMPNLGTTDDNALLSTLQDNARAHHYTTFIGIGVDFNSEIIDAITAVEGANYYSVHSAEAFRRRMGEEFEYMVTPLAFDLAVSLDSKAYDIAKVYGTTVAEDATATLMEAKTIFPSAQKGGKSKGGVILVQLDGEGTDPITLDASWTTPSGRKQSTQATVEFPRTQAPYYADSGIRKAVLLSRYADLLKNWMVYERDHTAVDTESGISVPPEDLGRWERQSVELTVTPPYDQRLEAFRAHFQTEMAAIGDETLEQEHSLLTTLESVDPDE